MIITKWKLFENYSINLFHKKKGNDKTDFHIIAGGREEMEGNAKIGIRLNTVICVLCMA